MLVVLDTNILLVSISERSKTHWVYRKLIDGEYELAVTDAILNEYQEKISEHWHPAVAATVLRTLVELPNVKFVKVFFRLNLIQEDPDDNCFADCAFAANARYLVSNVSDFNILKQIPFPRIEVIRLREFEEIIKPSG